MLGLRGLIVLGLNLWPIESTLNIPFGYCYFVFIINNLVSIYGSAIFLKIVHEWEMLHVLKINLLYNSLLKI